ncbi:hypothetical protein [Thalassobius sp. I31.1]|uniref:hypothetical protein n=1 Tax=Thalassobius sp. I31.1 TaxID=2109912 RepID=UPI0018E512F8|nr:hypothetical protein [Thalassobius sp. I31.1]
MKLSHIKSASSHWFRNLIWLQRHPRPYRTGNPDHLARRLGTHLARDIGLKNPPRNAPAPRHPML